VSLDGYTYEALSETTEQTMAAGLASNPVVTAAIKGYAASAVNQNGSLVAVAVVIEFNPAVSSLPQMADAFWSGAASSLDTTASTSTLAGQEVRVIDSPASKVVGWQSDELMVLVFAPQMAPAQDVATALLEAHA